RLAAPGAVLDRHHSLVRRVPGRQARCRLLGGVDARLRPGGERVAGPGHLHAPAAGGASHRYPGTVVGYFHDAVAAGAAEADHAPTSSHGSSGGTAVPPASLIIPRRRRGRKRNPSRPVIRRPAARIVPARLTLPGRSLQLHGHHPEADVVVTPLRL